MPIAKPAGVLKRNSSVGSVAVAVAVTVRAVVNTSRRSQSFCSTAPRAHNTCAYILREPCASAPIPEMGSALFSCQTRKRFTTPHTSNRASHARPGEAQARARDGHWLTLPAAGRGRESDAEINRCRTPRDPQQHSLNMLPSRPGRCATLRDGASSSHRRPPRTAAVRRRTPMWSRRVGAVRCVQMPLIPAIPQ